MLRVEWTSYPSPIGALTLVECEAGPLVVEFPMPRRQSRWQERLRALHPRLQVEFGSCAVTRTWLDAYFAGRPEPLPFPYQVGRWFALSPEAVVVARAMWSIPLGETRSYDDVARGTGLNARQVGQLVGANHLAILIPCHRVVGKNGSLVGYGGGLERKRWLLAHELRTAGVVLR